MKKVVLDKVEATLPTKFGEWKIVAFETSDNKQHAALIFGDIENEEHVLVRVHSECLTGDVFHSMKCDCRMQLEAALEQIKKHGSGVLVYLRQEGRDIGLFNKIKAYKLQEQGRDTVQANEELGLLADARDYSVGGAILKELGIKSICLMTNNPKKISGLKELGLNIVGREPVVMESNKHNERYLSTKKEKMGHMMEKNMMKCSN